MKKRSDWIFCSLILALFVGLRLFSWSQVVVVEDHDSIAYVREGETYRDLDFEGIWNLSPDSNPVMPVLGAVFSVFTGGDVLSGFRVVSFFCSVATFFILIALGRRLGLSALAINTGLLFFAINPFFVKFSFSALSEPIYLAVTSIGVLLLLRNLDRVRHLDAVLLALVFGVAFLTRTEGLLYLGVIPVLALFSDFLANKGLGAQFKKRLLWCVVYCGIFALTISPQIVRVSSQMGHLGFNGRQVWTLILKNDDGKGYEEKLYGLDHSKTVVNLRYVSGNPDAQSQYAAESNLVEYIKIVLENYEELLTERLPELLTALGIALAFLGGVFLVRSDYWRLSLVLFSFLCAAMVGPLIHNVVMRHIAILGPPLFLVQGAGVAFIVSEARKGTHRLVPPVVLLGVLAVYSSQLAWPLKKTLGSNPSANREYDHFAMQRFVDKLDLESDGGGLRVVARKIYLSVFSGNEWESVPYGTYDQLVEYCQGNAADYLFLEHHLLSGYPFLERFEPGSSFEDFELIHEEEGVQGGLLQLYRINNDGL